MDKLAYTVEQATALGAGCRSELYEAMREGRLAGKKRGRRTIILHEELVRYLTALPNFADCPPTDAAYGLPMGYRVPP